MSEEIAVLGIEVQTESVEHGTVELNNLTAAGARAERSTAALSSAFAGLAGAMSLSEMSKAVETWQTLNAQLVIATGSMKAGADAYTQVSEIAARTGQSLEGIGMVYQRLAQNASQIGISQTQIATTVENIAKAMALSGASAESAQSAITQFGQALASGALRGDELNSILEQSPRLARAIADGLNVPIGKLKELGEQGSLTSVVLADALEKATETLDKEFAKLPLTMSRALQKMKNEWVNTMGTFESTTGAFGTMAKGVDVLAKHMDVLAIVGGTVMAVYGGKMVSAIVGSTTASIASSAAARAEAASKLVAAQASVAQATALVASTTATATNTAATQALAAANTRLAAATAGVAAASRGAMVLGALGGPIGIITTALTLGATAWMLWKDKTIEATAKASESAIQSLDSVIAKIEEMNGRIDQVTRKAYNNTLAATESEAKTVAAKIGFLQNQLDSMDQKGGKGRYTDEGKAAQFELNALASREIELQKQLGEARAKSADVGTASIKKFIDENAVGAEKVRVNQEKIMISYARAIADTGGVYDPKVHSAALKALNDGLEDAAKGEKKVQAGLKNDLAQMSKATLDQIRADSVAEVDIIKAKMAMRRTSEVDGLEQIKAVQMKAAQDEIAVLAKSYGATKDKGERALLIKDMERVSAASKKAILEFDVSLAKVDADYEKYLQARLSGVADETESLLQKAKASDFELQTIGLTADQIGILTARRYDEQIALKQGESERLRAIEGREAEAYAIDQQIVALQRLKSNDIAKPKLQEQAREWEKFSDDINRALTDALMRGFESGKSFGQNFVDSLKNSLKTAALKMVVNVVMSTGGSLVNGAINAVAGTSGGNGGAGTNYLGLASNANTAYNLYNGSYLATAQSAYNSYVAGTSALGYTAPYWQTAAGAALANAATPTAAGYGISLAPTTSTIPGVAPTYGMSVAPAGSTGAGLSTGAVSGILAILAGMYMSGQAWQNGYRPDGNWDKGDAQSAPLWLRDFEFKINKALFGEEWAGGKTMAVLTGSSLQKQLNEYLWKGLFGSKDKPTGITSARGTFSEDDGGFINGQSGYEVKSSKGWLRGKSETKTIWSSASDGLIATLDNMYDSVRTTFILTGALFNDFSLSDKLKGFTQDIFHSNTTDMQASLDLMSKQLTESMGTLLFPSVTALRSNTATALTSLQAQMAQATKDGNTGLTAALKTQVDALAPKVGEVWSATFSRLLIESDAVSRVFGLMGKSLTGVFGSNNADGILSMSDNLVTLFGSIEALNSSFGAYYGNFYTQAEQTDQAWKEMSKSFATLGQTMPTTREGFRALVDGLDLSTVAGEATFKALMDLQGGFAALTPALGAVADAVANTIDAAGRKTWGDKLAVLNGTKTERSISFQNDLDSSIDAVVKSLITQVYALEDAATAATAALQTNIDTLQTSIESLTTTYGDVASAMTEINPPAKTLVDSWHDNKAALQSLQATFDQFFGQSVPDAGAAIQALLTQQSAFDGGASTAHGNADNARLQGMTPGSRAAFWKNQEASLWQGLGQSADKSSTINQIMAAYSNARAAELEALTADQTKLNDTTKTGLQTQLDTWKTTLSVIEKAQSFAKSLDQFMGSLSFSDLSSLNYTDQLNAAESLYSKTLSGAMSGDENAMGNFTGNAQAYLEEARAMFASGAEYADIYAKVTGDASSLGLGLNQDGTGAQSEIDRLTTAISGLGSSLPTDISTAFSSETADGYIRIENALTAGSDYTRVQMDEQKSLLQQQIAQQQEIIANQQAQIEQQAALHAELMAQQKAQSDRLATLESNANLATTGA